MSTATKTMGMLGLALAAALLVQGPAEAVTVSPDVPALPAGGPPALPYVDVPNHRVVDGTRRVDITGMQGTVTQLHKVDGGYVVARLVGNRADLVLIRTSGDRRLLTSHWYAQSRFQLPTDVIISSAGNKLVFNTAQVRGVPDYRDTVTMSLPAGKVLHRRTFSTRPDLLGFLDGRVLLSVYQRGVLRWTPGTTAVSKLTSPDELGEVADLTAGAYAGRASDSQLRVRGIPPRTTPDWATPQEDWQVGSWSLDDQSVAAISEVTDDATATSFSLRDATDGTSVLDVLVEGAPQITWESDAAVLITARQDDGRFQMIRCSVAGSCERVGGTSATRYAPYVVATRRNS